MCGNRHMRDLRALLGGAKCSVDYYQREYRWATKRIAELTDDLSKKVLESYEVGDKRTAVEGCGHYFYGSIIVSDKEGKKFVIDGQQRLTSITLLLMLLHCRLTDAEQRGQLAELIFSQKFGMRSFNIDVSERNACMEVLFTGKSAEEAGQPESVVNNFRMLS